MANTAQIRDGNATVTPFCKYVGISTQTTTLVKTGEGFLKSITINTPLATGTVTVYDALSASGTPIATITKPGTLLSDVAQTVFYNIQFNTGLTVVTGGANQDITVAYL